MHEIEGYSCTCDVDQFFVLLIFSNSAAVRSQGASEIDFKGDIPMAECVAYGKLTQLTGGRGGYPVGHRFPGGVIEGQQRKEGENVYEDIEGVYETVN